MAKQEETSSKKTGYVGDGKYETSAALPGEKKGKTETSQAIARPTSNTTTAQGGKTGSGKK